MAPGAEFARFGCNDGWDTTFTPNGANAQVNVIVSDGAGGIYIGGAFTSVQGVPVSGIAKWDGASWTALGSGINGTVNAIAISGNDIYVAGGFSVAGGNPAKNVAKWNGSSWSALGAGLGGGTHDVRSVAIYGSDVYFGGDFSVADGSPATGIVRWDGTAYSALPIAAGRIDSLVVNGGSLYVGGNVGLSPGIGIGIVKYDGSSWSGLGTQPNTIVSSIVFSGADMYVGGGRIVLTGQQDSNVAKFNGTTWTRMGFFGNGIINAVTVHGGELYVGGYLPDPPNTFNSLAKWNGSSWVGVGSGIDGGTNQGQRVTTLSSFNNTLYVGGNFTSAGGQGARNIARYASGSWAPFYGTGLDGPVNAIAVSGSDVYVGGSFVTAGTVTANRIARWNGTSWFALGTGVAAEFTTINAIAVAGDKVYAGGSFTGIGGVSANNIAVWNGTTWATLGTGTDGVNGRVTFIIVRGEDVYVGGDFTTAGGVAANRVAKWNGTSWSGLNSTIIPNTVTGMAFMGNDLYVGAATTTAANPAYFSKYDGTNWTALGADLGDRGVSSVAVIGSDVYVGGGFDSVNGMTVNRIVKWNGSSWSALAGGLPPASAAINGPRLTVSGNNLIAIGDFTTATGGPANRIARWNGTSWTGLGTGLNANGSSVVSAGGDIFAGGAFTTAGCNASPYFARYRNTVWTGSSNTDWHTAANWGGNSVPGAGEGVSIASSDAVIATSDVTLSSLIVSSGRTVTIASGRTLTVTGSVDLSNGSIAGPGTLVVNDLTLTSGNLAGLAGLTVNGNLYFNGGTIVGSGTVAVTACRASALVGGNATSFINSPLQRCVNSTGIYRFPVGSNGVYAPVELANIVGSGTFTVEPKSGAYSGAATGLPANRLQRWWSMANGGISQADLTFVYSDAEIVGLELRYKVFSISGGAAQLLTTSQNTTTNRATVNGVTSFSAFTLADGPSTPQMLNGRVTGASGRGAENVVVTITDQSGNVRYAQTNPFGYFRFPNVMTWETYTVIVQSKRFTFSTSAQTFLFPENAASLNFTATNR